MSAFSFTPIGVFHCAEQHRYDAPRQPQLASDNHGCVALEPGHNYEQALRDLDGFSHVWLVYVFDRNEHWKPLVQPPRAPGKVGVFASRAPYRPNPIGLSCVALRGIDGLRVEVGGHDLLDGTPILDIKPYVPYADSIAEATAGWVEALDEDAWTVALGEIAELQLAWLETHGVGSLRAFIAQQLSERPCDTGRKRTRHLDGDTWEIAYRTWRVRYGVDETARALSVEALYSGYSEEDLAREEDPYGDTEIHRAFAARWKA